MVHITEENDDFIFEIKGWHKIWALKSEIIVPKKSILKAYQNDKEFTFWKGFRMPGTEIPGYIAAGTFYKKGWDFWDVIHKKKAIIVELKNHRYKKLIIEVEHPEAAMQLLNDSEIKP
jgi:hypothetical protein